MFSNLLRTLYGILNFNLLLIVNERLSSMTFRSIFLLIWVGEKSNMAALQTLALASLIMLRFVFRWEYFRQLLVSLFLL